MTAPYEEYPHKQNDATTRPAQSEIETAPAQYMNYQLQPQPSTTGNTEIDLWEYGPVIPPPPPPDSLASITTQDQVAPIQPQATTNDPITTTSNTLTVSLKNIFIGTCKSILYFFGILTACFGLLATLAAINNVAVGIGFLFCLAALALLTSTFYKRRYHLNTLRWQQYLKWIAGSTIVTFILLILDELIAGNFQYSHNLFNLIQDITLGPTFLIYGVVLVITAFRKRSTTNSLDVPRRKKSRA